MPDRLDIAEAMKIAGLATIKPRRRAVWVVTDKPADKTPSGLLWLPPEMTKFYYFVPHLRLVRATVVAVGPDAPWFRVGDRIGFARTWFARFAFLGDECMLGFLDATKVAGFLRETPIKQQVSHEVDRTAPPARV